MHRFYLPPGACEQGTLTLTGSEAHHALHVLRARHGQEATVLDGAGRQFLCRIEDIGRNQVTLAIVNTEVHSPRSWGITLLQALPRGKIIEDIIQKATELGVTRIVPILSERVVAHLDERSARDKQSKWQAVAIEAIKQCGSPWLPKVEAPVALSQCLKDWHSPELALVGSLQPNNAHPRAYFNEFEHQQGRMPKTVAVFVGPEGDFSPPELRLIEGASARPITLGPLVLRSETAAIYCLSVVNYELQWHGQHQKGKPQ